MIDPSIALSGKPVQFDGDKIVNLIAQGQQRRQQMATQQQEMQLRDQEMQQRALTMKEQQRTATEGEQYRALFKPTVGPDGQPQPVDIRSVLPKVDAINPNLGMSLRKSLHEQEKGELDTQESKLKVGAEQVKQLSAIAGTITDEPSFLRGIKKAVDDKVIPLQDGAALMHQGWSPETQAQVQKLAQAGMTVDQQHAAGLADLKEKRDALDAQHKADMRPFELAEAQGKATQITRENDATALAAALRQGPRQFQQALAALPPDRQKAFGGVAADAKPEDVLQLGMKPHEAAAAITAATNAENNVSEMELELRASKGDANARKALNSMQQRRVATAIASRDPGVRVDHEIAQYGKPFDEMVKGTDGQLDKILDAEKMISGGAVQQALGIPKILTALVSGNGSGVRITKGEMEAITKARGIGGDVEAFFSKMSGNGTLTTEQKKQMQSILEDVRQRIVEEKMIARSAQDEMMAATGRDGVIAAANKGRASLDAHALKGSGGGLSTGHKVGEVVEIGGKKVKITKILPGDKFEGDEVK